MLSRTPLLLVLLGILACDTNLAGDDILYPGAPIVDLEELPIQSGTFRYMVASREPVPYDIAVRIRGRYKGVYEFNAANMMVRDAFPPDGRLEKEFTALARIKTGSQVDVREFSSIVRESILITVDSPNPIREVSISATVTELTVEILPFISTGNEPYNVGIAKLTLKR